ncbi:hypothetical protein [Salinispora arenicola]|uniref:hypothetical protein n=1 Tax=Salinispora arenicola TaxID=168697 RepID=UPI0027DABCB2|nr:hypothetical protein [Salinispora arenicola]
MKSVAAECYTPTVVTLTGTGTTVTGRAETVPGGPLTADTAAATLAGMARLIARHPGMFGAELAGYAAILPGRARRVRRRPDRDHAPHLTPRRPHRAAPVRPVGQHL